VSFPDGTRHEFTIQPISKPFIYGLALDDRAASSLGERQRLAESQEKCAVERATFDSQQVAVGLAYVPLATKDLPGDAAMGRTGVTT
jgi:hypothetical protein